MKAIILSAGQGSRLLPYTESTPKCLLPVDGDRPALGVQLQALADCGVDEVRVMIGFQAEKVEAYIADRPVAGLHVKTLYNPFFDSSDNLVTAWLARPEMDGEFVLMNGDTLYEAEVLRRLLAEPEGPITLVVNTKATYDSDDMKVSMDDDGRLRAVSKTLSREHVNGESIGLMRFLGDGIGAFESALDRNVRSGRGIKAFYLSVIDQLSKEIRVGTSLMTGLWWGEVDSPDDLESVRAAFEHAKKTGHFDVTG